jgi:hypothetical protein
MSISDPNKPPDENKTKPVSDKNKRPLFEPKRVIHLSKPLSDSGDSNSPAVLSTGNETSSPTETKKLTEPAPGEKVENPSENSQPEVIPTRGDRSVPQFSDKRINPGLRLRALLSSGKNPPSQKPASEPATPSKTKQINPLVWGVAAVVSLGINAVLVGLIVTMNGKINGLNATINGLLSGMYNNFTEMDTASIYTTITADTQVPIDFVLPIQQNTDVTLTQGVVIPNANIVINSGSFSINSQAKVTIPAGTTLPVALNISVPVQFSVPVSLVIPLNIPVAQTGLHQSLTGLQNTVRTYYCIYDKNAQFPQGTYLCENHDLPTAIPGVP